MPTVGRGKLAKKFPYDPKGEAAAANFAAKTGQKLTVKTGDEGKPWVPPSRRKAGTGDEGMKLAAGGKGKGDEGLKLKKKVPKKPPKRMK